MDVYRSKSSIYVKIATAGAVISLLLVVLSLVATERKYGMISGAILSILIIGTVVYFYSNSLDRIILEKDRIILKKNIGQIKIVKYDILKVHELAFSNLTMNGSKGVFGFIGKTMDGSISLVKDRKHMLRITTKNKKYIFSSERSAELVTKMKTLYSIQ